MTQNKGNFFPGTEFFCENLKYCPSPTKKNNRYIIYFVIILLLLSSILLILLCISVTFYLIKKFANRLDKHPKYPLKLIMKLN